MKCFNQKVIISTLVLVLAICACACGGTVTAEPTLEPTQEQREIVTPASTIEPTSTSAPTETPYVPKDYFVFKATPQSDCFSMIAYNEVQETLLVCFRTTGVYYYYDFPETEYEKFKSAESLGSYFNNNIKGYYSYEKGTEDDWDYIQYLLDDE